MNSILKLAPLIREGTQCANGTSKSERHFLDFVVDGESLWEALVGERHGMVSILCAEYSADETAKAVGRLILNEKADLPNDRRSLFVCSECGDLGCGAITAVVERQGETITWKAFGYENTYAVTCTATDDECLEKGADRSFHRTYPTSANCRLLKMIV
jgi:hypothetical protein